MPSLSLELEENVMNALNTVARARGRKSNEVAEDAVRRFVEREAFNTSLDDPSLRAEYEALASDDIALSEEGLAAYCESLAEADRA